MEEWFFLEYNDPYSMIAPTFDYEQQYWSQGISYVAGIDEAGMGALAGPVVAATVIFSEDGMPAFLELVEKTPIRDSKLLSPQQREKAVAILQSHAKAWAIGEASVAEIDSMNIRVASHLAMQRAIAALKIVPDILMIDGKPAQISKTIPTITIIKGDQLSYSIAAASILAKVYRDNIMKELDLQFPQYGFASHKGYGAKIHMDALIAHGATEHHRKSYAPITRLTL
jgi:ribonuclease HII